MTKRVLGTMTARCAFAAMLAIGVSLPVRAAQDSMNLALSLGNPLGSENFCGLNFDQDAIKVFITQHVSPKDMDFTSDLQLATQGKRWQNENMSASLKTAYCEQTARVARAYGFIK
jgi:hypothetical protein